MSHVFLSYAREDSARAERVATILESAGFDVWWDRHLKPGESWSSSTEAKVRAARVVLVLWSASSIESQWVRNEARAGLERGALVPVTLDGSAPPLEFSHVQVANLEDWPGDTHGPEMRALVERLRTLVGGPTDLSREPPVSVVGDKVARAGRRAVAFVNRRWWLLILTGVAVWLGWEALKPPPDIASMELNRTEAGITVGGSFAFEVTLRDTDGGVLQDRPLAWRSEQPTVASVKDGVVTGVRPGQARILVSAPGGWQSEAVVTVDSAGTVTATDQTLSLTTRSARLDLGDRQRLQAVVIQDGRSINDARVQWTSDKPEVASVDTTGLVTGIAPGLAQVEARYGSQMATAVIEVADLTEPAPLMRADVALSLSGNAPDSISAGDTVRVSATVVNRGRGEAERVVLRLSVAGGVVLGSPQQILGNFAPGQSRTISIAVRVSALPAGGFVEVQAEVLSDSADPDLANNRDRLIIRTPSPDS